jgi:hypothetical protein
VDTQVDFFREIQQYEIKIYFAKFRTHHFANFREITQENAAAFGRPSLAKFIGKKK